MSGAVLERSAIWNASGWTRACRESVMVSRKNVRAYKIMCGREVGESVRQ